MWGFPADSSGVPMHSSPPNKASRTTRQRIPALVTSGPEARAYKLRHLCRVMVMLGQYTASRQGSGLKAPNHNVFGFDSSNKKLFS